MVNGSWKSHLTTKPIGFAHVTPSSLEALGQSTAAIVFLSGPMISLGFAAIAFAIAWETTLPNVYWLWAVMSVLSFMLFLTLLPYQDKGVDSYGEKLRKLFSDAAYLPRWKALSLTEISGSGSLRPRDWPADAMEHAVNQTTVPYMQYLAYVHLLDKGEPQLAAPYLAQFASSPGGSPEYALEAAFFRAFFDREIEAARQFLNSESRPVDLWVRKRAEAAILLRSGSIEDAHSVARSALDDLKQVPLTGANQYEVDLLQLLLQKSS